HTLEKLTELARRNFTTLYTVLLTAYLTLLYRHTGQDELIVGSPTSGRTDRQFQSVIGYFVNLLAIRARLEPDLTFQQFLTQVRETVRNAFEHQEYPFPLLVGDVCPDRDPSRTPVFQTTFVFEKAPLFSDPSLTAFALGEADAGIDFNSLRLESVNIEQQIAQFDLSMFVGPVADGLAVSLQYNTHLFKSTTIERMLDHFKMLIDGIVAQPEQQISEIPLLTKDERDDLSRFNDTERAYPATRYLHQMFEAQAETTPDAVALLSEDGSLSYRELNRSANRLAHYLRSLGVGPEVPVAVFLNRTPELIVSLLAILKAGGAYVPLDPQYPHDRIAFMLEDTAAPVLICRKELVSRLPKHMATLVNLDRQAAAIAEQSYLNPRVPLKPENLSHVIYTSGSTGRPKGVAIEHRSVINFLHWANNSFSPEELAGVVASTSICFDLSVFEIFAPLSFGGTVILVDDALHLATHAAAKQVTLINTVPSAMAELLRLKAVGARARTVNLAGEALQSNLVQQIYEETNVERVLNLYGPTEYTTYTTGQELGRGDKRQPAIGRPIANTQVHIVDPKLQTVPIGVVGEVCAGGQGLARGYLNRPDLTAERFIPDSLGDANGRRLYRTGDLGQLSDNGEIQYVGRKDHQVKIRGYRIELGEIESALLRYPGIKEAVVAVRKDVRDDKQMVGYIVLEPGETVSINELRDYLRTTLPVYMVPQFFMTLAALPLTSNGKLDRRALPPPPTTTLAGGSHVAPRNELEEIVASVWCEVLGLAQVGSRENFFDIGGQSLKAVQVVSRLSSLFQVELPVKIVFEAPTVQNLAAVIAQQVTQQRDVVPIRRVPRDRHLPLSFAQQRLWFLHGLDPQSAAYNISFSARIVESFNVPAWEQSLSEILKRHEILRTTFAREDGRPVQIVAPHRVAAPTITDLRSLPESAKEEVAQRLITEESRRPFDLEQGPLFRSGVLRLGEDDYILLISMHHIICDGWSAGVFIRELMVYYEAFSTAQPSTLAELNLQYADFAAWQQQSSQVERAEPLISYWKKQLSGAPAVLDLPQARPRPAVRSRRGGVLRFDLPSGLRDRLIALGRSEDATLFMTLLASFQLLLWRYSGQTDLLVGTPVANRSRAEVEQLIGCFVNTIVMRTDVSGDPTFRELLVRVREVAISAYMHQEVPFERVVSELTTERDLSRTPIYQVVLVLQNTPLEELRLGSVKVKPQENDTGTAKFDLTLQFTETERGLEGRWEYSTDLFDEASIELMAAHLQTLLEGIVENPERHISELPILRASERRQLLAKCSQESEQKTPPHCLHELFEQQVALAPEATALVFGDECLSYAQLNAKANQLAHHFIALGLPPEARVGILLERSMDMVVAMLAVLKAGGAYVPLDPGYPAQRIGYILKDCDATLVLTQDQLDQTLLSSIGIPVIRIDRDSEEIARHSRENVRTQATKANAAYVIYTSGSSGQPKGVLVTHENVTRLF
ncbi:MAG TPA: amino acid adenylation domain-containing protein, partial [Pyrinomonadaceae bacterium]